MEMGFCRIQNLVVAFWLVTGSISSFSPETPEEEETRPLTPETQRSSSGRHRDGRTDAFVVQH